MPAAYVIACNRRASTESYISLGTVHGQGIRLVHIEYPNYSMRRSVFEEPITLRIIIDALQGLSNLAVFSWRY